MTELIPPPTKREPSRPPDPRPPTPDHYLRIDPPSGWQLVDARELWRYRELLAFLVWRDVKVRYKQAVLGVAWAVLQPAVMMVVFSVFLGRMGGLSGGDIPYPLFTLSGLIAWQFFANAVANAGGSVVGSERLITKIYFPRLTVPFSAVGAAVFDFLISLGLLAVVMAAYGHAPSWQIVFVPLIFAILLVAALGVGTLLAALTVTFRDFRFVTPFLMQVGMYATPTIYMLLPADPSDGERIWMAINPLVAPIASFRASILGGAIPWTALGISAALALATFAVGCLYFRKVEDEFADTI